MQYERSARVKSARVKPVNNSTTAAIVTFHLDINLDDANLSRLCHIVHRLETGAIDLAVNVGMLEKLPRCNFFLDLIAGAEMISDTVDLTRTRRARGVAHAEPEDIREIGHELVDEGALAGA